MVEDGRRAHRSVAKRPLAFLLVGRARARFSRAPNGGRSFQVMTAGKTPPARAESAPPKKPLRRWRRPPPSLRPLPWTSSGTMWRRAHVARGHDGRVHSVPDPRSSRRRSRSAARSCSPSSSLPCFRCARTRSRARLHHPRVPFRVAGTRLRARARDAPPQPGPVPTSSRCRPTNPG